jgi:5-methylcytosine-specific restriction endonuclease McrA
MKLQSTVNVGRPTDKNELYPLIKYLIEDEGLSAQEACDEAGIHRSTFYRWCRIKGDAVSKFNKSKKSKVKRKMPSAKTILEYWRSSSASWYLDNMSKSAKMKFDFHLKINPIHQQCFACNRVFIKHKWGSSRSILERSHIVPHALGGSSSAVNFVLLCKHCHLENPNVDNEIAYLRWLQSHKSRFEIVSDEIHHLAKAMIDRKKLNKALSITRLEEIIPKGTDIENYSVEHQGVNFSTVISVLCSKIDDILDEHHEIRIRRGC